MMTACMHACHIGAGRTTHKLQITSYQNYNESVRHRHRPTHYKKTLLWSQIVSQLNQYVMAWWTPLELTS